MRRALLVGLVSLGLVGCQTVTFARTRTRSAAPAGEWHHNSVFSLVEVSGPVDLRTRCPSGWSRVTTEESFLTGFVPAVIGGLVSAVTPSRTLTASDGTRLMMNPASQVVSTLWDPEYVEVSCDLGHRTE
jgi:hypothetical protein